LLSIHKARPVIAAISIAVFVFWATTAVCGDDTKIPFRSGVEENTKADRVIWPIFVRPVDGAEAKSCDSLSRDEIRVRENGELVEVTNVDREKRPLIHAIVLDTSGSMRFRLDAVRESAVRYIESLGRDPGEDRVVVLSFDEELVLHVPLTRLNDSLQLEGAIEAVRKIPLGTATNLEDALYLLGLYLGSFTDRSVVILLSDGRSSGRLRAREAQFEYIESMDQMSIFSIGLNLAGVQATRYLGRLSKSSGGRYYGVRDTDGAAAAFQEIQETVAHRAYVIYVPAAQEISPTRESEWIEVKIRSRNKNCRILHSPARNMRSDDLMVLQGRDDLDATLVERDAARDEQRIVLELNGWVAVESVDAEGSFHGLTEQHERRTEVNVFYPGERAELWPITLEDLFLRWLLEEDSTPSRSMIDGTTFIELRMQLAQLLVATEPRFAKIAQQRMEAGIQNDLERDLPREIPQRLLEQWTAEGRVAVEAATTRWNAMRSTVFDAAFASRLDQPSLADRKRRLIPFVNWLGDLNAGDLVNRLEVMAAALLLNGEVALERWWARWPKLREWLPEFHIVTPLWMFHDRENDVRGFYRVVDPPPFVVGDLIFKETLSSRPFGLLALDWLFDAAENSPASNWTVSEIIHGRFPLGPLPKKQRKKLRRAEKTLRRISVTMSPGNVAQAEVGLLDLLISIDPAGAWLPYCVFELPRGLVQPEGEPCSIDPPSW